MLITECEVNVDGAITLKRQTRLSKHLQLFNENISLQMYISNIVPGFLSVFFWYLGEFFALLRSGVDLISFDLCIDHKDFISYWFLVWISNWILFLVAFFHTVFSNNDYRTEPRLLDLWVLTSSQGTWNYIYKYVITTWFFSRRNRGETAGHGYQQGTGQEGRWEMTVRTTDLQNNELLGIHVLKIFGVYCLLPLLVTDFCLDWGNFIYIHNVSGAPGYNLKYFVLYSSHLKCPSINRISLSIKLF